MRPLVIDTNVTLDLLLFADPRTVPLGAALAQGEVTWIATAAMREELRLVLDYPNLRTRLEATGREAADVLGAFDAGARLVEAAAPGCGPRCRDEDDQKFIDLAVAHRALLLSKDLAVLKLRRALAPLGVEARDRLVPLQADGALAR